MAKPGLFGNFKFRRLARALGGKAIAVGSLEVLWAACWENLTDVIGTPEDVEAAAEWNGEKGALFAALRDSTRPDGGAGFIEEIPDKPGVWRVHDLWHHAPEHVFRQLDRKNEREKKGTTISAIRAEAGRRGGQARAANLKANGKQTENTCLANVATPAPPRPAPPVDTLVPGAPREPAADAAWDRVVSVWSRVCVPVGFAAGKGTKQQREKARIRCRDPSWFAAFEASCAYAAREPFYRGASKSGWVMTLGWLLEPNNAEKTAERAGTRKANGNAKQPDAEDLAIRAALEERDRYLAGTGAHDPDDGQDAGARGRERCPATPDGVAAPSAGLSTSVRAYLASGRRTGQSQD